jgi:hypothetical protein
MENEKYEGFTNYATWRVLEEVYHNRFISLIDIFDENYNGDVDEVSVRDYAEEVIFTNSNSELATGYAKEFLSYVNWYEIAKHIKESIKEMKEWIKNQELKHGKIKTMKTNVSKSLIKAILKTKKQFILYNLTDDKSSVLNYRLSDDFELTGNNRSYSNFKVISCIKNQITNINL